MKLICIQCGNTDFTGIDTSRPLICPVPGCGWHYDPQTPEWIVLRDASETDHPFGTATLPLDGWKEEDTGND